MKKLRKHLSWHTICIVATVIVGTLLHFVYDFTGKNAFAGIFSAVNESTWEHMKIAFWPALTMSFMHFLCTKQNFKKYLVGVAGLLITILVTIPTFFYTYVGVIGNHFVAVDILIFVLAIIFGWYTYFALIGEKDEFSKTTVWASLGIILALTAAFLLFTKNPPPIGLFANPLK